MPVALLDLCTQHMLACVGAQVASPQGPPSAALRNMGGEDADPPGREPLGTALPGGRGCPAARRKAAPAGVLVTTMSVPCTMRKCLQGKKPGGAGVVIGLNQLVRCYMFICRDVITKEVFCSYYGGTSTSQNFLLACAVQAALTARAATAGAAAAGCACARGLHGHAHGTGNSTEGLWRDSEVVVNHVRFIVFSTDTAPDLS